VQAAADSLRFIHNQQTVQSAENRAGFDMTDITPLAAALRVDGVGLTDGPSALAPASSVMTLDGALPVEHLYPGDRVITRHGARALLAMDRVTLAAGTPIVEVARNALGGRPDRDIWLPAAQRILIRDWRAKALYGQAQACVPAGQLADGDYVRLAALDRAVICFALRFGRPEVLYVDGLELASADLLRVTASATQGR
jgi:hypothetical protein